MQITGIRISILILAAICSAAAGRIIYVDDTATGNNNGTSWDNAYVYLQEALADANDSEKPVEIRVAQGIYKPDGGIATIPEFDRRTLSFQLINDVTLKGGYAGIDSSDPNARDLELYETILSGDLNSNDIELNDPSDLWLEQSKIDNSHHIVTSSQTDETSVLDGFTITGGFAIGPGLLGVGGGMYNYEGSPNVRSCKFIGNLAATGGGICNYESNPTLNNCTFTNNSTDFLGGGIYNQSSNPVLTDCTFIWNSSEYKGGGMYNFESSPFLTNCAFNNNSAQYGGGMCNRLSNLNLNNCTFSRNSSDYKGGGMYNFESSPVLTNCTFCNNLAYSASNEHSRPVINYGGGMNNFRNSQPTLVNCILWSNNPDEIYESENSEAIVRYSNIQGDWEGVGNIDSDPLFADPNNGDYHLKSQTGRWDPNSESWVADDVTSPCIDAGDPNSDWISEIWPHGERINMGAYGGTRQASLSMEMDGMSLPHILYIYDYDRTVTESFESLLEMYGISVTSVSVNNLEHVTLTDYNLIIVGDDTSWPETFEDGWFVAAVEDSNKPILGLGDGGYDFFGDLGLWIGNPYGGHGSKNGIRIIDPELSLFSTPYPIAIPDDKILQLYTETRHVGIYLWPDIPETVFVIGSEPDDVGYYPLVMEHNRYLLWGFTESPEKMTETGKKVFINTVIYTANIAW